MTRYENQSLRYDEGFKRKDNNMANNLHIQKFKENHGINLNNVNSHNNKGKGLILEDSQEADSTKQVSISNADLYSQKGSSNTIKGSLHIPAKFKGKVNADAIGTINIMSDKKIPSDKNGQNTNSINDKQEINTNGEKNEGLQKRTSNEGVVLHQPSVLNRPRSGVNKDTQKKTNSEKEEDQLASNSDNKKNINPSLPKPKANVQQENIKNLIADHNKKFMKNTTSSNY